MYFSEKKPIHDYFKWVKTNKQTNKIKQTNKKTFFFGFHHCVKIKEK